MLCRPFLTDACATGDYSWYATYAGFAGVSPADPVGTAAGMPTIDSLDIWPTLSKVGAVSPRTELFMDHTCLIQVRVCSDITLDLALLVPYM